MDRFFHTLPVGRAIVPAAGFQPAGPAGKRVRSQDWLPHIRCEIHFPSGTRRRSSSKKFSRNTTSCSALALAVRRHFEILPKRSFRQPHPRLLRHEYVTLYSVGHGHNVAVGSVVEQLVAISRPDRRACVAVRDLPPAALPGRGGRKRAHKYFHAPGLGRMIRQPPPVRREDWIDLLDLGLEKTFRLSRLPLTALVFDRHDPDLLLAVCELDVPEPLPVRRDRPRSLWILTLR
jgi:hypothetical protein